MLVSEVRHRMTTIKYGRYYINGFAMLFAIETGVRVGELCALKWEDIYEDRIHIHSQQLSNKLPGGKDYYLVPYTKNEKGESEDGKWIKTDAYVTFLRRLCSSKGFKVTNNHALRMSLNSNVLLPLGVSVADRAAMLGHSIETNLKFYSFAQKGYLGTVRDLLDNQSNKSPQAPPSAYPETAQMQDSCLENIEKGPQGTPGNPSNVIIFEQKKSLRPAKSQAFH